MEVQVSITSGTGGDLGRSSTPHVARNRRRDADG